MSGRVRHDRIWHYKRYGIARGRLDGVLRWPMKSISGIALHLLDHDSDMVFENSSHLPIRSLAHLNNWVFQVRILARPECG